jgi:hypothetical protein
VEEYVPRSRTSENEAHLSRLQAAIEEVLRLNLERTGLGGLPELDERPEHSLLDGVGEGTDHELWRRGASSAVGKERNGEEKVKTHLHSSVTLNVKLVPGDTNDLLLESGSIALLVFIAKIREEVEIVVVRTLLFEILLTGLQAVLRRTTGEFTAEFLRDEGEGQQREEARKRKAPAVGARATRENNDKRERLLTSN